MMRNVSIRVKGIALAVATVCIALMTTGVFLFVYNLGAIRSETVERQASQARMLAHHCGPVLAKQDRDGAVHLLDSFSMLPSVEQAVLFDNNGKVFAHYPQTPASEPMRLPAPSIFDKPVVSRAGKLEVQRPIFDPNGKQVGLLFVRSHMGDFSKRFRDHVGIMVTILIGSLALSILLAERIQHNMLHPIQMLADAASRIRTKQDFSIRVHHEADDELGGLCKTFNDMVEEVQDSREALRFANEQLERRVAARTAQLTQEVERRKAAQRDVERARDVAEQLKNQAVRANKAKSEFLANMSHEIRTPLNGVIGFTDLLIQGADRGDESLRRDYLRTIANSGKHLLLLINDILDISKIEAGQLSIENIPYSPHAVMTEVVNLMRVEAEKKGLALHYDWKSRVPDQIVSDPARMRQMVMNLVSNAIKFTDSGAVTVVARVDELNERLSVTVRDTGHGIAEDRLKTIFDPFVQADSSVTRRFGGTGLGLSICKKIANALDGDIIVESREGLGSRFTIEIHADGLKQTAFRDNVNTDIETLLQDSEAPSDRLDGAKVLVVEDGPTNRKLIRIILERAGACVVDVENGLLGVEAAIRDHYDLILMDMQMPIMDGYTATRRLRELAYSQPIIGLTAHAMHGDEQKCLDAGCSGYLTKPINDVRLIASIRDSIPNVLRATLSGEIAADPTRTLPPSPLAANPDSETPDCTDPPSEVDPQQVENDLIDTEVEVAEETSEPIYSTLPTEDEVFAEIVSEFVEYLHDLLLEMDEAIEAEEWETLRHLAHTLKGAGGTAGFDQFTEPSRELENAARNVDESTIQTRLQQLKQLADLVQAPDAQGAQA